MKLNYCFPEDASFLEVLKSITGSTGLTAEQVMQRIINFSYVDKAPKQNYSEITWYEASYKYRNSFCYKKMADTSKNSYNITLTQFKQYLDRTIWLNLPEESKHISTIKKHVIEDFLNNFTDGKKKGTNISIRTLRRKLATIKSVFRSLYDDDLYQGSNPTRNIRLPKESFTKPDYFTPKQAQLALDYSRQGYFGERNFTILLFMFNTGCRQEGVENLNWVDVDFKNKMITLDEKGSKKRQVPLVMDLADQLNYYKNVYSTIFEANPNGPVFVNLKGTQRGQRITGEAIRSFMEPIYKKLGFQDCKLHRTRRTFALQCLQAGMTLTEIRDLLGHADIGTTVMYLRLNDEEIRKTMLKHFPFAVLQYEKVREFNWESGDSYEN